MGALVLARYAIAYPMIMFTTTGDAAPPRRAFPTIAMPISTFWSVVSQEASGVNDSRAASGVRSASLSALMAALTLLSIKAVRLTVSDTFDGFATGADEVVGVRMP